MGRVALIRLCTWDSGWDGNRAVLDDVAMRRCVGKGEEGSQRRCKVATAAQCGSSHAGRSRPLPADSVAAAALTDS